MGENEKEEQARRNKIPSRYRLLLEDVFAKEQYPPPWMRRKLADRCNVTARTIQVWFQNARQSLKHRIIQVEGRDGHLLDFTDLYKLAIVCTRELRNRERER